MEEAKASCTTLPGLDAISWLPSQAAVHYGTFATLLAGFCISGLLWIVSRDRSKVQASSLVGLWSSVLPLATAALLYFEMSGELDCRRAAFDIMVPSFALAVGAVVLFVYLGDLVSEFVTEAGHAEGEPSIRGAVVFGQVFRWTVVFLASFSLLSLNAKTLQLVEGNIVFLVVQVAGVLVALAFAGRTRQPAPRPTVPLDLSGVQHLRPLAVVGLCVVAYVASFGVAIGLEQRSTLWFEGLSTGRTMLWCCFLLVMLGWRRPPAVAAPPGAGTSSGP